MISILSFEPGRGGLAERLKKGEISCEQLRQSRLKINYINIRGRADWKRIAQLCGESRGWVLCSPEVLLPEKLGFKRFYSRSLERLMAINGALEVLSLLKGRQRKITLCFCDLDGSYSRYAPLFLPLCGRMKVLTRSGAYSSFPDYAMGEYGACVSLHTKSGSVGNCNVFVAPKYVSLQGFKGGGALMFTSGRAGQNGTIRAVNRYGWSLPPSLKKLKPLWMSAEYFSQALYSVEKCRELARLTPHTFYIGDKPASAAELSIYLAGVSGIGIDTTPPKAYNKL